MPATGQHRIRQSVIIRDFFSLAILLYSGTTNDQKLLSQLALNRSRPFVLLWSTNVNAWKPGIAEKSNPRETGPNELRFWFSFDAESSSPCM
jgi:hypothetical protein